MLTNQSSPDAEQSLSLRTTRLIGRGGVVTTLASAINDASRRCYLYYFVAGGGIGKTRLLEEIDVMYATWQGQGLRITPIIDLYHSETHSPSGLRRAIVSGLDPDGEFFQDYHQTLDVYRQQRKDGAPGSILEELRKELDEKFHVAYAALAQNYRLVIRLDTLELLQHESDIVQELCQVDDADTAIKTWLLTQVTQLPNTVIVCAGRPQPADQPQLAEDFKKKYEAAGHKFQVVPLNSLSPQETEEYLENLRQQRPDELTQVLTPARRELMYKVTQGRPIYLALLLDLALYGQGGVLSRTPINEEDLRKQITEMLQNKLTGHVGEIVNFLARARKGLDAELLQFLVGDQWTQEEVEKSFYEARRLAVVKTRVLPEQTRSNADALQPPSSLSKIQLFLHDEVYELFDFYYKDDYYYGKGFERLADFYRTQRRTEQAGEQREDWQTTQLYYEFQVNPSVAYFRYYIRWDEEAIKVHETGLDMRLRDETLRFINRYTHSLSPVRARRVYDVIDHAAIDRDCAVRWVKRYVSRGQTLKANEVASRIRASKDPLFDWDMVMDPVYKAGLLTVWSEARLYTAAEREGALTDLEEAVELLSSAPITDEDQRWLKARILGRAHNNIGYLYRTEGRYGEARQAYQRALHYFAEANIPDEEADTRNNLAFVLAALGRLTAARNHADRARAIREASGRPYPLALSRNTLGYIYILEEHPIWAIQECEEALRIFERFRSPRGEGLSCIRLGHAYRKRGDQWKLGEVIYPVAEAEAYFRTATEYLERAIHIFKDQVSEPLRLWEAYNELGSLYCDWGWLARQKEENWQNALNQYTQSIAYQEKAIEIAKGHHFEFQLVDSLDDLAQVYGDQSFLLLKLGKRAEAQDSRIRAEAYLDEVEEAIPATFKLIRGAGFVDAPEPGEAYWLSMGKARMWRGVWIFRDLEEGVISQPERAAQIELAIGQFLESVAYFQRYDESRSYFLNRTLRYFINYMQQQRVAAAKLRKQVDDFTREYNVDLRLLHEVINDILGV